MKSIVQLQNAKNERDELRLLKLLNKYTSLEFCVTHNVVIIVVDGKRKFSFKLITIENLKRRDCIASNKKQIALTELDRKHLKRHLFPDEPFSAQHTECIDKSITENGVRSIVT